MSLSNCSRCGRMFHKSSAGRVCSDCIVEEEQSFIKVRDFLEENPGCNLGEVSAATGVEASMINKFLREGRLATLGDLSAGIRGECKRCGKQIDAGRFCRSCIELMGSSLQNNAAQAAQDAANTEHRHGLTRRPETIQDRWKDR